MAVKNAQQVAQKWATNTANAGQALKDGINSVTEAPTAQAAKRQDAYVRGVMEAAQSGKWAAGLNRVTLQQWKDAMLNKAVPRIQNGTTAAQPKVAANMAKMLPYIANIQQELTAMPRGDLNANIERMTFFIRKMSEFKK